MPAHARNDVEGYLYPATYDFGPDATATSIFKAMIDKFKSVATEIDLVKRAAAIGQSPHDIVTVASILEKEGYAALVAALEPAPGDWTYFLSIPGTKEMRFTNSYKQFLKDQEDMRAAFDKQSSGQ